MREFGIGCSLAYRDRALADDPAMHGGGYIVV